MTVELVVSVVSGAISLGSFIYAVLANRTAAQANDVARAAPRISETVRLVSEELRNAEDDRILVKEFFFCSFKTLDEKVEHRRSLDALRDASQRTVYMLDMLTSKSSRIQATKASRDKIDDSFWENQDLEFSSARASSKFDEYRTAAEAHIEELQNLLNVVAPQEKRSLPSSVPPSMRKGESKPKRLVAGSP